MLPTLDDIKQNIRRYTNRGPLNKYCPELLAILDQNYSGISNLSERLYLWVHKLDSPPMCAHCHQKKAAFRSFAKGYLQYCSTKCASHYAAQKIAKACLERYGVDNPNKSPKIREKTRRTNLERYGVEYPFQSKIVRDKIRRTNLERYGVEYTTQSPVVKERARRTNLERYGVENAAQSNIVRDKLRRTNLERYGVEYPSQSPEIRKRVAQTNMERYGVTNIMQSPIFQERARQTNLERYGVEYPSQSPEIRKRVAQTNMERYGVTNVAQKDLKISYPGLIKASGEKWIFKCPHTDCNHCSEKCFETIGPVHYMRVRQNTELCTKLLPIQDTHASGTSLELIIRHILDENGIQYITNDRNTIYPQELDIYIPSKKIAIECNGIYWHSTPPKSPKFHYNKWLECKNKNIQLLTIWEDWLVNKPKIVKSLILSKLGIYEYRIGARQCELSEVNGKESVKFLNENHIQGACKNNCNLGLYYNGDLIALMTFNKKRIGISSGSYGDGVWELSRFCSKMGWQIIGGAQRLIRYFIKQYNPTGLVSYASNDISNGNLYEVLGFKSTERCTIGYWYIHPKTLHRYHRFSFSKNRIKQLGLAPDCENWTEKEAMLAAGYLRIYDSGVCKWILNT